jgi:hypothetical protein
VRVVLNSLSETMIKVNGQWSQDNAQDQFSRDHYVVFAEIERNQNCDIVHYYIGKNFEIFFKIINFQ